MNDRLIIDAFKNMPVPLMIVGPAGEIRHSNQANDRLFGYDKGSLSGLPLSDVLPDVSCESMNARAQPAAAVSKTDIVGRSRHGVVLRLRPMMTAWTTAEHGLQYALLLQSVDANVQAEWLARERARNAIEGARIAVFEYNRHTDTVTICDIWRELLELKSSEDTNVREVWRSRVHPEDLGEVMAAVGACLDGSRETASCDYRLRSRDGLRWRWIQNDMAIAERDENGNVIRLSAATADITDRKLIENALRRSVEQFKSSFDSAVVGMALVGTDGKFLQVNAALCALTGYAAEDLLRTDFQTITYGDDLTGDVALFDLLKSGKIPSYQLEKRYVRANGAIMWGLLSVGLVRDDKGRPDHLVAQIVDVTEQKRLTEMKSKFVSTVSHELRTPLTSILGSLALLSSMDTEPFSDQAQRLIYIAEQNGLRLQSLINDTLDFEKFSAREMQFDLACHRIITLVEHAVLTNLAWADKYSVTFETICPDRALSAFVDPKRFQQVMANLLSNAAKFATTGSQIKIAVEGQQDLVRLSISNDGEAIPHSFRDNVFRPFSQANAASNRSRGGTGLGLSITKQILEQTGGEIGFESEAGLGTTFWFTVPIQMPE